MHLFPMNLLRLICSLQNSTSFLAQTAELPSHRFLGSPPRPDEPVCVNPFTIYYSGFRFICQALRQTFLRNFRLFFLFPQVLHSCFGQAARIFCRFLAFFTKGIPPAAPAFRSRTAFRQRGRRLRCLRFAVTARTIFHAPPPVENARFLSVFALHSFRRFPRGNFVEFIKFSTIGVDFPQMMWYTIILRIPVERQVESLRKTVFHNHCSAEFACPADHGDPRRSCRTGFEVT